VFHKTILPNGLRILSSSMPQTHSVCIAIFIGVGSRYETDQQAGTSHFIEHILFRGTPTRPTSRLISEAIEGIGGILNGATDKEMTFYWCKVTREHFRTAAEVLGDMLLNSNFDPTDIEKERQVIVEEIHMCKDSPSQSVGLLIDNLLWPGHALGRDIAGTAESVGKLDRRALREFYENRYSPENTVVTVTGNVSQEEVISVIDGLLGKWTNPGPRAPYNLFEHRDGPRLKIEKRETEQAHLCLALPGIALDHPRRFQLDMLNVILGEGMSSRLFSEIRDKMGLAYSISSYVEHFLDSGSLTVAASVDPENLNKTIEAALEQLELLKEPAAETEVKKAREISKGRLLLRMEDSRNVAGWLGGQEMLLGRILTLEDVISIIDAVTPDEISTIAREVIDVEQARLAVVGPVEKADQLYRLLKIG
jgi:predicted Zn-dependent peptidase